LLHYLYDIPTWNAGRNVYNHLRNRVLVNRIVNRMLFRKPKKAREHKGTKANVLIYVNVSE